MENLSKGRKHDSFKRKTFYKTLTLVSQAIEMWSIKEDLEAIIRRQYQSEAGNDSQ